MLRNRTFSKRNSSKARVAETPNVHYEPQNRNKESATPPQLCYKGNANDTCKRKRMDMRRTYIKFPTPIGSVGRQAFMVDVTMGGRVGEFISSVNIHGRRENNFFKPHTTHIKLKKKLDLTRVIRNTAISIK